MAENSHPDSHQNILVKTISETWGRPVVVRKILLLIRVFVLLAYLRLLLSCVTLQKILDWLTPSRHQPRSDSPHFSQVVRYTDALVRRIPLLGGSKCLLRALALYYFATRGGFPVQLHCGVRRTGRELEGHAWLSFDGQPFFEKDKPDRIFTTTFSFPVPIK